MKIKGLIVASAMAVCGTATAELHERLGGDAYYDDVLNITWLTDANFAKTETFGVEGIDQHFISGGAMSWATAHEWIAALNASNHLGFSDWRLPRVRPVDGVEFNTAFSAAGATDLGYANYEGWKDAQGNPTSELAYMYYVNLGNIGLCKPDPEVTSSGSCEREDNWGLKNLGPFANLFNGTYWTGVIGPFPDRFPDRAWRVHMHAGAQDWAGGSNWVWAVRDGDVGGAPTNEAPVAVAGADQAVRAGDVVHLDGSGSFDDNTPTPALGYAWTITAAPVDSSAILQDADTATPSMVVDLAGTYVLALVVTDEGGLSSEPSNVTVSSTNLAPIAVIELDASVVVVGTTVAIDGRSSSDPEEDPLTYQWQLDASPADSGTAIVDAAAPLASLTPDVPGAYGISLTVSDQLGPGMPADAELFAITAEAFVEAKIADANDILGALQPGQVTNRGNQTALGRFLHQALAAMHAGDTDEAIHKLEQVLLRTNGCGLRGSVDIKGKERDWVTDCEAQIYIQIALTDALGVLNE